MAFHPNHLSQDLPLHHFPVQQQQANQPAENTAPNWLNTALLRSQQEPQPPQPHAHFSDPNFLNLHTATTASESTSASQAPNQWLSPSSSSLLQRNHSGVVDDVAAVAGGGGGGVSRETMVAVESGELKNSNSESMNNNNKSEGVAVESGGGGDGAVNWQNARYKAEVLAHPLYEQLLSEHVACLRIATPVDQLPRIDAQLAQSQHVVAKYSALGDGAQSLVGDDKELDQFMVCSSTLLVPANYYTTFSFFFFKIWTVILLLFPLPVLIFSPFKIILGGCLEKLEV